MKLFNIIILLNLSLYIISQTSIPISFTNPGTGYTIAGNIVTITTAGTYDLTGSETDKQIIVASSVKLNLNSFSLINTGNLSPIIINSNQNVEFILSAESTLQDSSTNTNNGVIYLQNSATLSISGTGTLNINPNKSRAVYGLTGASFIANDGVNIKISSNLANIGGIYSLGKINFNNAIYTYSCQNGRYHSLYSQGEIRIVKGTYIIYSWKSKGIKTESNLYIGEENAINDSDLILNITTLEDGIEAMKIEINSGVININTGEEGINVDSESYLCDDNIRCSGNCACSLVVKKGNLTVITREDGINANGDITFSGGDIIIFSSGDSDTKPIEQDGLFQIKGGNVIAAGSTRNSRVIATTTQMAKTYSGAVNSGQSLEATSKNSNNKLLSLIIPLTVNSIYFNFPEDFYVKINNVEITTSNATNSTTNNGKRPYYDDDDDDDWDDDDKDRDDDDDLDDDWDDDDYYYDENGIIRYQSGSNLKILKNLLLLLIIGLI